MANEIVARQFIFRMREFEQMEMQFFVKPGTELDWFKKWKEIRLKWQKKTRSTCTMRKVYLLLV